MAGHDRPPQQQPDEGTRKPQERTLDPYVSFVGAFLRQVVTDALSTPKGTGDWTEDRRREAQAFLLDPNRLAPWIELTGAAVDKMQGALLCAAGLARAPQKVP